MPNGKQHDHPLTDILVHELTVYGEEADALIRKIAKLCGPDELFDWWKKEIGWKGSKELALHKSQLELDALLQRAKKGGWEMQD